MSTKTLTIPVADRDALMTDPHVDGLTADERRAWSKARRGLVPTTLLITVSADFGRFEVAYEYARGQGRAGPEIELVHGAFRSYQRNALLARAHLRRVGPRRASKAYIEYARFLKSLVTYAESLPADYRNRWRLLVSAATAAEHWKREKEALSQTLVAPHLHSL